MFNTCKNQDCTRNFKGFLWWKFFSALSHKVSNFFGQRSLITWGKLKIGSHNCCPISNIFMKNSLVPVRRRSPSKQVNFIVTERLSVFTNALYNLLEIPL